MSSFEIVQNHFGYYEVSPKPTPEELNAFYSQKYYQNPQIQYSPKYTDDEQKYFLNREQDVHLTLTEKLNASPGSYLDLGCGEGWALSYFHRKKWNVLGFDFSNFGIKTHNPEMVPFFQQGDLFDLIANEKRQFDFISLKNVLEHVLDPISLSKRIESMLKPGGFALIVVPNDFSNLQKFLLKNNYIDREFWVAVPDHLNYFSQSSLQELMRSTGLKPVWETSDFPVDLNLFGEHSNYILNPAVGKYVHSQKVRIENFLSDVSPIKKMDLQKAYANMGLGRNIFAYFQKPAP